MPLSPALPPEIAQALARGWTVLTANQRAARTLRRDFDLDQRAAGLAFWQPPPILAWDSWLASLWQRLLFEGHASELLLSPTQEHTLWRAIIAADGATRSLRPVDALAKTASAAWRLLHDFSARRRLGNYAGNSDTRAFARWAAEFEHLCGRSQYLSEAQLPEALRAAFAAGRLTPPAGLLLAGFDSKRPAQLALLDAAGASIEDLATPPPATSLTLASAPDEHEELAACARWLRTRLTEQPSTRLAVIVPSLETSRAEIDRSFRQILAPELNDVAAAANSGPFEFSLGVPLASAPMVATALDLLRWTAGPLPLDRVSALLLSPHFAVARESAEHLARAEFDAFVVRQQSLLQPQISLDELLRLAYRSSVPVLLRQLRALEPQFQARNLAGERTHADWAATIHALLAAAGWAIPANLDSTEFQTRRKWESALDELATLDFDNLRVSFKTALASLERIAAETLFAPESRHAPIQIMGPLESAGSTFDAAWFLCASDLAWPTTPATNPLLPWPLQRDLAMPGANPAVDAAYALAITHRIAASAPTAVFSYAAESASGAQRPSAALSGLSLQPRSIAELAPADASPSPITIEEVEDVLPAQPPAELIFRGGSGILQAQAACSFRAFAEKRLFASALESVELGLDAGERGSLVHKVLEKFWSKVRTQTALRQMTTAERDDQLGRAIDDALARDASRTEPGWSSSYLETERQRLLNLLRPWLTFEANGRSAFAVKALEQTLDQARIGPLHLQVRIDRVDTSLVGGEPAGDIILDYKTGDAKPSEWLGERPDEPQLPLYAVLSETSDLAAIAFASVRPGEKTMGLSGFQSRSGVLPKGTKLKADSLDAQVENWRQVLIALADEFHAGTARVSPKQYPSTCRNCEQRLLCRLDISKLEADANEDFANETENGSSDATDTAELEVVRG